MPWVPELSSQESLEALQLELPNVESKTSHLSSPVPGRSTDHCIWSLLKVETIRGTHFNVNTFHVCMCVCVRCEGWEGCEGCEVLAEEL